MAGSWTSRYQDVPMARLYNSAGNVGRALTTNRAQWNPLASPQNSKFGKSTVRESPDAAVVLGNASSCRDGVSAVVSTEMCADKSKMVALGKDPQVPAHGGRA